MATKRRRTFERDYLRSVFREWWNAVIVVGFGIASFVGSVVMANLPPFLWVSVVLLGVVVAQVRAARQVWVRHHGDVRGVIDECLHVARELERVLAGKEEVATPSLKVLRWVLDADRVLQERAPAYQGELTLILGEDKALLSRGFAAATGRGEELSQQDARLWLHPHVAQLKAIRKELGNH